MSDDQQYSHEWKKATELRVRGYMVINGRPCTILEKSKLDYEFSIVARDIFTGKELEATLAPDARVDVPHVTRRELPLSHYADGFLHLTEPDGTDKDNVPLPDNDIGRGIKEMYDAGSAPIVTVLAAMGEEAAISVKEESGYVP